MSRKAIRNSPEWDAARAVNREYEERLYDYYGRPVYWAGENDSKPRHRLNVSALDESGPGATTVDSTQTARREPRARE